jgi:FSR family fosmidomycin resistance protein-like MFS transporter
VLGQEYLPNRVGLASGVTMGLAFSFGGILMPALGWVADHHGLQAAIYLVAFLPVLCTALTLPLLAMKSAARSSKRV